MSDLRSATPTIIRIDDRGDAVADIAARLVRLGLLEPPGRDRFDAALDQAVRRFQQERGLTVDGVVGPNTYRVLDDARWGLGDRLLTHLPGRLLSGDDVVALQQRLLDLGFKVGRIDGLFGERTENGVRAFQRNIAIPPDGTCGPATLKALARLAPIVSGGKPNAMRAEERLHQAGPQLRGKVVVVDAATVEPTDPTRCEDAASITHDLARRVEGRLVATGVQAFLTHSPVHGGHTSTGGEEERADFANRAEADLCVSLHLDSSDNPDASGVASYFYGLDSHGVRSSVGERFAGLVQREIVARTGLPDLRTHPKTWDLLRRTRMPAVRIDVGYISSPQDAARLSSPGFRDVVAEAIVVAVQRVYLSPETDAQTGVLRLGDLRGTSPAAD